MITLDRSWQGKGLGSDLAVDALSRARNVSGEVKFKLFVLDVIDDGGDEVFARRAELYRRLGFQSHQNQQDRMPATIAVIQAMFDDDALTGGSTAARC